MSMHKLQDHDFVAVGSLDMGGYFPGRVLKFNAQGNTLWQKSSRILLSGETDVKQAADGTILYTATQIADTINFPTGNEFLQCINPVTGDSSVPWQRTYSYALPVAVKNFPFATSLLVLPNGDNVVAGMDIEYHFNSVPNRQPQFYTLRRTDSQGNTIWHRRFAELHSGTWGTNLCYNRNGNFVLSGMRGSLPLSTQSTYHPTLIEVSPTGDSIKGRSLVIQSPTQDEATNRVFNNIIQTQDGNYVFAGEMNTNGFLAKVDQNFNLLWYYERPKNPQAWAFTPSKVVELEDSSLLFMGFDRSPNSSPIYLTQVSKSGQFMSQKC